jgi:hypothetical protein
MVRGVGYLMQNQNIINGTAIDIETIARLRSWMEDEARKLYGYSGNTKLFTDYIQSEDVFKFQIIFSDEFR